MTDKERAIAELQQWLRNISKSKGDEPAIIPDGIFSAETKLEVEAFQYEKGLPVTGVVDYFTWEAIKKEDGRITQKRLQPVQVAPITNDDLPLKRGDDNSFTDTLKLMLNFVAEEYENFDFIDEKGFGEATQRAVEHWQRTAFIDATGQADKATWNTLASFYLKK